MKPRWKAILNYVLDNPKTNFYDVLEEFSISKRTFYYDIEAINQIIREFGHIGIINQELIFIGHTPHLRLYLQEEHADEAQYDVQSLLYEVLNRPLVEVSERYNMSKYQIQELLEPQLKSLGFVLNRVVEGDELAIRNELIRLMHFDNNILNKVTEIAKMINYELRLNLSDYSLAFLSQLIEFVEYRQDNISEFKFDWIDKRDQPLIYPKLTRLLDYISPDEQRYITAYLLSLSSVRNWHNQQHILQMTHIIVSEVSLRTNINFYKDNSFIENLYKHLLGSYYRIKYNFPVINPILNTVFENNIYMFQTLKQVFAGNKELDDFRGISDHELAFMTLYFASYAQNLSVFPHESNRVLIVCPFGVMISKSIESQLIQSIPGIEIVDSISIQEFETFNLPYDWIITTVPLTYQSNEIVVKPILSEGELTMIFDAIYHQRPIPIDYQKLIGIISKSSTIIDSKKLLEDLYIYFNPKMKPKFKSILKEEDPMLSELIDESRAQTVASVNSWEEAIRVASQPLLQQEAIKEAYIDRMIESIDKHGPYIILADGFALPHASNFGDVNELSLSLLRLEEEIDFLGHPVKTVMVLATVDKHSHIRALTALAELLYDPKHLEVFTSKSVEEILELIRNHDRKGKVME